MAGTRTAPTVNGAGTHKLVSVRYIDASGDKRADEFLIPAAATDAQIEALVVALQAGSNASIHEVRVTALYKGVADKNNATNVARSPSIKDYMYFTAFSSNPDNKSKRALIPAPLELLFVSGSDTLDPTSAEIIAVLSAWTTLLGAGWDVAWGSYTETVETNEKVPI